MKSVIAFALIIAVGSASIIKPTSLSEGISQIQEIIAAIQSPSTNPATAAALEQMLANLLGVIPQPVDVGPALIDFPLPDGGAVSEDIIDVSPVVVAPSPVEAAPAASAPLVQIILNINQASASAPSPGESSPGGVAPVIVDDAAPVEVVDSVPALPVEVVDVAPTPVEVVDSAPVVVEPVIIGTPIIPSPAVVLPEELN